MGFPNQVLQFRYDYLSRRVEKLVLDGVSFQALACRRYAYDGTNLIAEFTFDTPTAALALVRSYTWGLDIAESMTDGGGVGALLQIADHASGKTFHPTYDSNGNVMGLINGDTGSIAAVYEYSPFGETIRNDANDPTIVDQPFRFSTEYLDTETGLYAYLHRFYDPRTGRFISRDPIEEQGGINLYGFCGNNAVNTWDVLGNDWQSDVEQMFGIKSVDDYVEAPLPADWNGKNQALWDSWYGTAKLAWSHVMADWNDEARATAGSMVERNLYVDSGGSIAGAVGASMWGTDVTPDGWGGLPADMQKQLDDALNAPSTSGKTKSSGGVKVGPIMIQLADGTWAPLSSDAANDFAAAPSSAGRTYTNLNADGTIVTYSKRADGSINIISITPGESTGVRQGIDSAIDATGKTAGAFVTALDIARTGGYVSSSLGDIFEVGAKRLGLVGLGVAGYKLVTNPSQMTWRDGADIMGGLATVTVEGTAAPYIAAAAAAFTIGEIVSDLREPHVPPPHR